MDEQAHLFLLLPTQPGPQLGSVRADRYDHLPSRWFRSATQWQVCQSLTRLVRPRRGPDSRTGFAWLCKAEVTCQVLHSARALSLAISHRHLLRNAHQLFCQHYSEGGPTDCCVELRQAAKGTADELASQVKVAKQELLVLELSSHIACQNRLCTGLFEVKDVSPPPRVLGIHSLPPDTHNGDQIEVQGQVHIAAPCQKAAYELFCTELASQLCRITWWRV